MSRLENLLKEELEEVLEEYFPKDPEAANGGPPSKSNRAGGLVLFAEAMVRIRKTIKAFGGCEKCFGKGYGTQTMFARGAGESDMGDGDVVIDEQIEPYGPCTCDRGKQIEKILSP